MFYPISSYHHQPQQVAAATVGGYHHGGALVAAAPYEECIAEAIADTTKTIIKNPSSAIINNWKTSYPNKPQKLASLADKHRNVSTLGGAQF